MPRAADPFDLSDDDSTSPLTWGPSGYRGAALDSFSLPETERVSPGPARTAAAPPRAGTAHHGPGRPRGDRRMLPGVALAAGVVASVAVGVGLHASLSTIDITSLDPLRVSLDWLTLAAVGLAVAAVAVILSVVALIRQRGGTAAAALLTVLILPVAAGAVGLVTGLSSLTDHVAEETRHAGAAAVGTVDDALEALGPAAAPLREWLADEYLAE